MDVAQTEKLIREKLENTGQLNKMRAMVIDASLRAIAGSSTADASELFTTSPNMAKLRTENPEELKKILSVTVECLQWLGLAYSANVVAVESGFKPSELTKRDGLASAFGLSTAAGSASIVSQLIAGGGSGAGASSSRSTSAANTSAGQHHAAPTDTSATNNAINTTTGGMTSFGSADVSAIAKPPAAAAAAAPLTDDYDGAVVTKPHKFSENSQFVVSRWSNRTFKRHNQVKGQPMNIDYLDDCKLIVLDDMDSTNIDDCNNTIFVFASVASSIFLRTCHNCVVYAACKQFRVRDCTNCEVHLFAGTDPVVETSSNILFKPFNLRLPGLKTSFKNATLDPAVNRYVHVYDFNAEDTKYPEPHFIVNHKNHGLVMEDWCMEDGIPECPVEIEMLLDGRLEPAASVESGQNKSHNIKTGAQAWTAPPAAVVAEEEEDEEPAAAPAAAPAPVEVEKGGDSYSDYESSSAASSEKYSHSEDDDEF